MERLNYSSTNKNLEWIDNRTISFRTYKRHLNLNHGRRAAYYLNFFTIRVWRPQQLAKRGQWPCRDHVKTQTAYYLVEKHKGFLWIFLIFFYGYWSSWQRSPNVFWFLQAYWIKLFNWLFFFDMTTVQRWLVINLMWDSLTTLAAVARR